ncbi:MAG TPA: aldose epimerase family protein [Blastocatellia bacterium]
MPITKQGFGQTPDGQQIDLYILTNDRGTKATVMTYGATLVSLAVPARSTEPVDVVLGYDDLDSYLNGSGHLGAAIGRYANRIAHAKFTLDGTEYHLPKNNGDNCLHGGPHGFDRVVWNAHELVPSFSRFHVIELTYVSRDGEAGFPGNLTATVRYGLSDRSDDLIIDYRATTDKPTVVNLTNHSYFNLAGAGSGDVLDHEVTIFADTFTPTDAAAIPTGELRSVAGTSFDFCKPRRLGSRIDDPDEQLKIGAGYDHNFVLIKDNPDGKAGSVGGYSPTMDQPQPVIAARVREPSSGRVLEVLTTEPAVQFYSGNHLHPGTVGKGGKVYGPRSAFCMETQHFPDSPNQEAFPTTVLRPGEEYHSRTVFRFRY